MSVLRLCTTVPYELFGSWTSKIHEMAAAIVGHVAPMHGQVNASAYRTGTMGYSSAKVEVYDHDEPAHSYIRSLPGDTDEPCADLVYLVYAGYDYAYVYLPTLSPLCFRTLAGANARNLLDYDVVTLLPNDLDRSSTPVHCYPDFDASLKTIADVAGIDDVPYASCAVEDLTISDVLDHVSRQPVEPFVAHNHPDDEIRSMHMFVNLAVPGSDPGVLLSYIKHAIVSRGYPDTMGDDVQPVKYTVLEAMSEMKRCNPQLYALYKHKKMKALLEFALDAKSKNVMEFTVTALAYEILCDSVVHCAGTTWCFNDGLWESCASEGYIWNFLTKDFMEYLNESDADAIATHIMSTVVRSRITKDLKMRMQDDNFSKLLDSRRDLIRMVNGVYNTKTGSLSDPVPSDYVSVVAGVPYQVFDYRSSEVSTLMYILGSIFPHKEVLDFFLLSCSTFLEGYNSPKLFYIWWGTGNNAKSLVQTLVMKTLGEYCSTAPTSLVTGKRADSSNATPELCHVEKRLVVFLQEPNPEEKIKAGKMKEMTGNDSMYLRELFKPGRTMVLKAKIVIVCNNVIEIPCMDAALRRRIVVVPFVSTFLDPAEYEARLAKGNLDENSYTIDLSVEKELVRCKSAFMYILCRRYMEWVDRDAMLMNVPEAIKGVTDTYLTLNNYRLRFINKYVVHLTGSNVAAADVYEMFKEWFRRSYPGKRVDNYEQFVKEMSSEGYPEDAEGVVRNVFVKYSAQDAFVN